MESTCDPTSPATTAPLAPNAPTSAAPRPKGASVSQSSRTDHGSATAGTAAGQPAPLSPALIVALEARNLDVELMVKYGAAGSDRLGPDTLAIPYFDANAIVATKFRTVGADKRFTQDKGGRQILWNLDCLRDASLAAEPLIITEGELDAIAALQAGYPRTVSVPGGAPSTGGGKRHPYLDEAEPLMADVREIIIAADSDSAGANLLHDLAQRLGKARCKWLKYPKECKDLGDALRIYGVRGVQETLRRAAWYPVPGIYRMSELPPVDQQPALDCGMVHLWEHYRIRRGDFCVVTGIPGHGKSSFINEITCRMAHKHGWNTVFCSPEQVPQVDHRRALRSFHAKKLEKTMTQEQLAAADAWIDRHFSFMVPSDDEDADLPWVMERCAVAVRQYGADIVVIDPWNELDHVRPADMSLTEYTGYAIKQFKRFARKYRVHLIVAAHPAKMQRAKSDGKYPVPSLYDISDSAHWANKPDIGIVIHRENLENNETSIRVVKSRYHDQIGRPGSIRGIWNTETTSYTVVDDDDIGGHLRATFPPVRQP